MVTMTSLIVAMDTITNLVAMVTMTSLIVFMVTMTSLAQGSTSNTDESDDIISVPASMTQSTPSLMRSAAEVSDVIVAGVVTS